MPGSNRDQVQRVPQLLTVVPGHTCLDYQDTKMSAEQIVSREPEPPWGLWTALVRHNWQIRGEVSGQDPHTALLWGAYPGLMWSRRNRMDSQ